MLQKLLFSGGLTVTTMTYLYINNGDQRIFRDISLWPGVYSAAYGTVHYKSKHSPGFGLPSVAKLP